MTVLWLDLPPSVNGAFKNVRGRGRVKTDIYKNWLTGAGWQVVSQRLPQWRGPVAPWQASLTVSERMLGDIDNRVKAVIDLLVKQRLVPDDAHLYRLIIERSPAIPGGRMRVQFGPYHPERTDHAHPPHP